MQPVYYRERHMLSPNMDRWVFASVSKHFDDHKGSMNLYIEGMHRDTRKLEELIELRVDGPYYTEVSKKYWKVYVEVNVLIQCAKNNQNFHRVRQLSGNVMEIFEPCISVYKYGTPGDDSYVGSLGRMDQEDGRNNMQVSQFGQVDPVNQLEQATVEAHYVMYLEE
jgi:hypothetical protein